MMIALLLIYASKALADEPAKTDIDVSVLGRTSAFFHDRNGSPEGNIFGNVRVQIKHSFGDTAALFLEPRINFGSDQTVSKIMNLRDDDKKLGIIELHEGYVDITAEEFFIRTGKQVLKWGIGSIYSPIDRTINPRDYTDLLMEENRLGIWAVKANRAFGSVNVELISMPLFTPSRFAVPESRWSPTQAYDPVTISRDLPRGTSELRGWCASVSTTKSFLNRPWDVNSHFCEKRDHYGVPRIAGVEANGNLIIEAYYPKRRFASIELATSAGPYALYGEGIYHHTLKGADDDYLEYLFGINRSFNDLLVDSDTLYLIMEYAGNRTVRNGNANFLGTPDFKRQFSSMFFGRVIYEPAIRWTFELTTFANADNDWQWGVEPKLIWRPKDNVELTFGVQVFNGDRETLFRNFRDNRRAYIDFRYDF